MPSVSGEIDSGIASAAYPWRTVNVPSAAAIVAKVDTGPAGRADASTAIRDASAWVIAVVAFAAISELFAIVKKRLPTPADAPRLSVATHAIVWTPFAKVDVSSTLNPTAPSVFGYPGKSA